MAHWLKQLIFAKSYRFDFHWDMWVVNGTMMNMLLENQVKVWWLYSETMTQSGLYDSKLPLW